MVLQRVIRGDVGPLHEVSIWSLGIALFPCPVTDLVVGVLPEHEGELQILPAARLLRSNSGGKNLLSGLLRLIAPVNSDDFDFDRIKPLLNAVLTDQPDEFI